MVPRAWSLFAGMFVIWVGFVNIRKHSDRLLMRQAPTVCDVSDLKPKGL